MRKVKYFHTGRKKQPFGFSSLQFDTEMDCGYIEDYFKRGFTTDEILHLLADSYGTVLSKRTRERILSKKPLWCRKNKSNGAKVVTFTEQHPETSGQSHGYRSMHQKCWLHGTVTDEELLIKSSFLALDPVLLSSNNTGRITDTL